MSSVLRFLSAKSSERMMIEQRGVVGDGNLKALNNRHMDRCKKKRLSRGWPVTEP